MSVYVAGLLALLGVLCIAAGVQNRGVELGKTIAGAGKGAALPGGTAPAAVVHPAATFPGGSAPAPMTGPAVSV